MWGNHTTTLVRAVHAIIALASPVSLETGLQHSVLNTSGPHAAAEGVDHPPGTWSGCSWSTTCQRKSDARFFAAPLGHRCLVLSWRAAQVPDFLNARIAGEPAVDVIQDGRWFREDFTSTVANRGVAAMWLQTFCMHSFPGLGISCPCIGGECLCLQASQYFALISGHFLNLYPALRRQHKELLFVQPS
jgi:hypothetical protein